jgi:hypothetical protein
VRLKPGDRVVLIGSALVEREQRYGYWEAALTAGSGGGAIQFHNLGWSGDTVFGEAQAGFGSAADGFRHLKDHVLALKPTLIVVGYGRNESSEGPGGLARFTAGLKTLLDNLSPSGARFVLLSPTKQEDLGRPLPDPSQANRNLKLYADAIRDEARLRGLTFVDLFDHPPDDSPGARLTDNGVHLTAFGYWKTAPVLGRALGLSEPAWRVEFDEAGKATATGSVKLQPAPSSAFSFRTEASPLALPPPAGSNASAPRVVRARGLKAGSYTLLIDGKPSTVATAEAWAAGVPVKDGPEADQAEKLRAAIVAKNRLYFHRWRPQNETYLFGFRKHEQGQNAREIPQFDPLVAEAEKEIAKLAIPVAHTYELKRDSSK